MKSFLCEFKKEKYESPVVEIVAIDDEQVITTSYSNNLYPDMN